MLNFLCSSHYKSQNDFLICEQYILVGLPTYLYIISILLMQEKELNFRSYKSMIKTLEDEKQAERTKCSQLKKV